MNHTEAWKLVAGDTLIVICYISPLFLFALVGASLQSAEDKLFPVYFSLGFAFYIVANLISAGVIK